MTEPAGNGRLRAALLALTVGGAMLRLPGLASRPLWMDEALTMSVARAADPWAAMAQDDLHPPLFAWLMRGVMTVSHAEVWLRAPSFLASVLMIPLAWWAARAWGRSGLAAATWISVCPPLVVYASEARPYALGAALILAVLAAVPSGSALVMTLLSLAATATLYGAWPVVLVAGAVFATRTPGVTRFVPMVTSGAVMAALAETLVPAQRAAQGADLVGGKFSPWFWTWSTLPGWAARAIPGVAGWAWTGRAGTAGMVAGVAVLAGLGWLTTRPGPRGLDLLAWAPVLAFVALAGAGLHPFGPTRHLIVLLPALLLWIGARLDTRPALWAVPWLMVAMVSNSVAPRPPFQDLPSLLPTLGDKAVVADASASWGLRWYRTMPTPSLSWRTGSAFDAELVATAPAQAFWFVSTDTRPDAERDLERWSTGAGRSLDREVQVHGAKATLVGPKR